MKFRALPVTSLEDATIDFEQIQAQGVDRIGGTSVPLKSPWTTPTLINSWTTRAGDPAGYFKDPLGFVHLRGRYTNGATGTTAFTLPAGFRPGNTSDLYSAGGYNGTTAVSTFVVVNSTGNVDLFYAAGATDVGLGGITFLAEN